jgi:hypothetical protein
MFVVATSALLCHCEERSAAAISISTPGRRDCFATLAMTGTGTRNDRGRTHRRAQYDRYRNQTERIPWTPHRFIPETIFGSCSATS